MASRRSRQPITAPDKGSFPLDHFHECEEHAVLYNSCLDKHQLMPKRCQKFQINYIECRMKHGLMGKDKIENLGYTQVNTWDSEENKKKELFKKLVEIDKMAERNVGRMKGKQPHDNNIIILKMSADSQLVLYVHLIPQTTQLIQQTIKVKLDENSVVADLRRAVSEQLDKHNDGNKIYTVRAIYSSDPQSDNTALESIPLKRVLGSFFESGSDVFCLVDIQVDVQRHVKPIEVKKAQTSTTNAKPTQQDIGGIFTTDKFITLTKYSFYESGKNWVKVLLDLKDIKTLDKNQIKIEFGKRSFTLHIYDFKGKNYSFSVPKLQCYILSEQSTMVIKNDSIQINLRKAKEDDNWWSLFRSKAVGEVDSD